MLVHHYIEKSAEKFPDKTALVCGDGRWSYRKLDNCANGLSSLLVGAGLKRQDRVIIFLENSAEAVLAVWGVLKAGGIFVLLNPSLKPKKFGFILNDSGATVLITTTALLDKVKSAVDGAEQLKQVVLCDLESSRSTDGATDVCPAHSIFRLWGHVDPAGSFAAPAATGTIDTDLAALIYTSGSTGEPKGVMSAHCNMVAAVESITAYLQNTPEDVILNVLPLSFDYGLYQMLMTASFGGTLVLEKSYGYSYSVMERIKQEQVTGFPIVPTIATLLLKMNGLGQGRFPSLRYLTSTGDVLPVPVIAKLRAALPTVKIFSMYGLTECKRVSYLPPSEIDARPSSVGIAIPNTEVFVLREDGEVCHPGEVGELVVRGSTVMQGYWNDPETTARVYRKGRYRADALLFTGDLFRMDPDGYLYYVSRKDDLLKVKEERISPKEIEDVILCVEGVSEAAVAVWSDSNLVKSLSAFVVPSSQAFPDSQALLSHCQLNLEDHLVPRSFFFVDHLPKTANGKIDRKALDKEFTDRNRVAAEGGFLND